MADCTHSQTARDLRSLVPAFPLDLQPSPRADQGFSRNVGDWGCERHLILEERLGNLERDWIRPPRASTLFPPNSLPPSTPPHIAISTAQNHRGLVITRRSSLNECRQCNETPSPGLTRHTLYLRIGLLRTLWPLLLPLTLLIPPHLLLLADCTMLESEITSWTLTRRGYHFPLRKHSAAATICIHNTRRSMND
jgi:hypothetical protein